MERNVIDEVLGRYPVIPVGIEDSSGEFESIGLIRKRIYDLLSAVESLSDQLNEAERQRQSVKFHNEMLENAMSQMSPIRPGVKYIHLCCQVCKFVDDVNDPNNWKCRCVGDICDFSVDESRLW